MAPPAVSTDTSLRHRRRLDRGPDGREDGGDSILGVLKDLLARPLYRTAEKVVMAGQRQPHLRSMISPQPGRPLNIRNRNTPTATRDSNRR